ncbi:MAG: hypothetical protein EMLJLAPB_00751 [Candidatus Argoarchaeum ethanivorans]|uniref:Uncharacterized protein n=1 Tax=Candidatus Argoarchaeum ethanivorans TaxID=2608793 RepID=A0A811T584_9EURY|nr:MAG: hypothetical protein KFBDDELM_00272 [Candidatus Argoarchaeum ethanivorans]CAD6494292.1 MAG: hypothetical protein EMLJLAPB_00751 [Candidatus Argoarchaeum ethanivorans]
MRNRLDYFLCWIWENLCEVVEIGGSGVYVLIGHTEIGSTDCGFWGMFESQVFVIFWNRVLENHREHRGHGEK